MYDLVYASQVACINLYLTRFGSLENSHHGLPGMADDGVILKVFCPKFGLTLKRYSLPKARTNDMWNKEVLFVDVNSNKMKV